MAPASEGWTERRVQALLAVAEQHATGVPLGELSELLPPDSPLAAVPDLASAAPPVDWSLSDGRAFRTAAAAQGHDPERGRRGERYVAAARDLLDRSLAGVRGLTLTVGVTGSTAFGEPESGDDCDFLVITRRGALWPFLLYAYLAVRRRRRRGVPPDEPSGWCFNYVLDATAAERRFPTARGVQFAREALAVRTLQGEEYYRGLLARSAWIRAELPGLYDRRTAGTAPAPPSEAAPAGGAIRLANLLLFPLVATYLQLVALRDNQRLRRRGLADRVFEVRTGPDHLEVRSRRYAQLAALYEGA